LWEYAAKAKKLIIWSHPDYISPKEWRKNMSNIRQIALLLMSVSLLWGCAIPQKADTEKRQTYFNRVSFRTYKGNKITYTNLLYGGIFIPAGTECAIKDIKYHASIKFIANGEEYLLSNWGGGKKWFDKFFTENRETIGLDEVNLDFRESILYGHVEVGMTKEEVLLSAGYPAYLGSRDRTRDDDRKRIMAHDDWWYKKTKRRKILFRFMGGKLAEIVGQY
jgi:hypothetical protein